MTDLDERFWERVGSFEPEGCWPWKGFVNDRGYGSLTINGRSYKAHRLSYEWANGPIPEGLQIDHLCRVRHCVNPGHMEAVTQATNIRRGVSPTAKNARKTHCPQGHHYDEENTYVKPSGYRICRICKRENHNAMYHRRAEEINERRRRRYREKLAALDKEPGQ